MRSDMAKVIVERPRFGSRYKYRKKGQSSKWKWTGSGSEVCRESIYRLRGQTRSLNEHLSPLRRYLHKQVGRPWNDIFHDICKHIRLDSAVQKHVRDHLAEFVQTRVIMKGSTPCHGDYSFGNRIGQPILGTGNAGLSRGLGLYVCPRTGLLKQAPTQAKPAPTPSPPRHLPIDVSHGYYQADGIWYKVDFIPMAQAAVSIREVNFKIPTTELTPAQATKEYGRSVLAIRRHQLSTRELRRLRIQNQPIE
jgi:hypothetical protein